MSVGWRTADDLAGSTRYPELIFNRSKQRQRRKALTWKICETKIMRMFGRQSAYPLFPLFPPVRWPWSSGLNDSPHLLPRGEMENKVDRRITATSPRQAMARRRCVENAQERRVWPALQCSPLRVFRRFPLRASGRPLRLRVYTGIYFLNGIVPAWVPINAVASWRSMAAEAVNSARSTRIVTGL